MSAQGRMRTSHAMVFALVVVSGSPMGTAQEQRDASSILPKKSHHVYLLIGQSNMAGRAPFTKDEAGEIPRCFLLNAQDRWEPAKNPLNRYSTIRKGLGMQKMNPGYGFAKAMGYLSVTTSRSDPP